MDSFSDLIDEYGIKALAGLLGVNESHVRTMKARNSIPPEYWATLIANPPKDTPLSLEVLMELRTAKKRPFETRGAA
jgi:hypothetical protein